jgi:hypothetical protein
VEQIHDQVAGLDVHRDSVTACFRQLGPRGGVVPEKDRFATTTAGLEVLQTFRTPTDLAFLPKISVMVPAGRPVGRIRR